MKKSQWIIGLSLSGILALSGTAFALNSSSLSPKGSSQGNLNNLTSVVAATEYQATPVRTTAINSSTTELQTPTPPVPNNGVETNRPVVGSYGYGYGMMGQYGDPTGNYNGGYGMMGGSRSGYGMMGNNVFGSSMMGGGYNAASLGINLETGQVSSIDQAKTIAKAYVQKLNQGLAIDELHEFANAYEVELKDETTGAKAFEFMIHKNGGQIFSEMGPNIMWNTRYGHMNWGNTGDLTISEDQATKAAQNFVAQMGQGYSISTPELAPGYYEFMVQKDGKDYAELDVNGYNGQIWLETWHGPMIQTVEVE